MAAQLQNAPRFQLLRRGGALLRVSARYYRLATARGGACRADSAGAARAASQSLSARRTPSLMLLHTTLQLWIGNPKCYHKTEVLSAMCFLCFYTIPTELH